MTNSSGRKLNWESTMAALRAAVAAGDEVAYRSAWRRMVNLVSVNQR